MAARLYLLLVVATSPLWMPAAAAQRMPSPGTDFDQLLRLADASIQAGDADLAARLTLLARSRILIRPDHTRVDAMLLMFDDMATGAAQRTRQFLPALSKLEDGLGSLGPVQVALQQLASPLITQVEGLIDEQYKGAALFVLEPLWALYPAEALELHARIEAIEDADAPPGDKQLMVGLRLSDTMSRGTAGAAVVSVDGDNERQLPIQALRRKTALEMVTVSQQALDQGLAWVAIDLAEISTLLFPLYPQRFEEIMLAARKQLTRERTSLSRAAVAKLFRRATKSLAQKSWRIGSDAITFPPSKGKPGLLVTKHVFEGDFRFAMEILADFEQGPPGFAFAYKGDDDFCAASIMNYEGRAAVKLEHFVNGKPERLHWWDGPAGFDIKNQRTAWPVAFELHGQSLWLQIGNSSWIRYTAKDLDLEGAIGLYLSEQTTTMKAKANMFEFESLPESDG